LLVARGTLQLPNAVMFTGRALRAVLLVIAWVGVSRAQDCVARDPSQRGYVYDLTPLINNTADYNVADSFNTAAYTFQFCRTIVSAFRPVECPPATTMVCERYGVDYSSTGDAPSKLAVIEPGKLTIRFARGACASRHPPTHLHG
jgi:hypothetical protein